MKSIFKALAKAVFIFFATNIYAQYLGWEALPEVQGINGEGVDISHQVIMPPKETYFRFQNHYSDPVEIEVAVTFTSQEGKTKTEHVSANLKPSESQEHGDGNWIFLKSIINYHVTRFKKGNTLVINLPSNYSSLKRNNIGGTNGACEVTPPLKTANLPEGVSDLTFPGSYMDWENVVGMPKVSFRRRRTAMNGNYGWQFQNGTEKTVILNYQYKIAGGQEVKTVELFLIHKQTKELSLPSATITVTPWKTK